MGGSSNNWEDSGRDGVSSPELESFEERPTNPPPDHEELTERYGRFQLVEQVATGGMGEVYLAREVVAGVASRPAAVKLIRKDLERRRDFCTMFTEEAQTVLRLNHPTIGHLYDFGEVGGHLYMALEWVDGVSLRDLVLRHRERGRRMNVAMALRIAADVAGALDYAHGLRRPVVHRDVSPPNVMIRYDGAVKLLDFGVAKILDAEHDEEVGLRGKLGYMSPEQCVGAPVDGRSDIFSLGVCLYETLTGSRLYARASRFETMQAIVEEPAPPMGESAPHVPYTVDAIVRRMLTKSPDERFGTAGHLQDALEDCLVDLEEGMSGHRMRLAMEELFDDRELNAWMVDTGVHSVRPPPALAGSPVYQGTDPGETTGIQMD